MQHAGGPLPGHAIQDALSQIALPVDHRHRSAARQMTENGVLQVGRLPRPGLSDHVDVAEMILDGLAKGRGFPGARDALADGYAFGELFFHEPKPSPPISRGCCPHWNPGRFVSCQRALREDGFEAQRLRERTSVVYFTLPRSFAVSQ